jgi:hypothetical protein
MGLYWSERDMKHLNLLIRRGMKAAEIGAVMGRSKNAVIGAIHRDRYLTEIWQRTRREAMNTRQQHERDRLMVRDGTRNPEAIVYGKAVLAKGQPLMRLASWACRFPLWEHDARPSPSEMLFCAEARDADSSYCAVHRNLCRAQVRRHADD